MLVLIIPITSLQKQAVGRVGADLVQLSYVADFGEVNIPIWSCGALSQRHETAKKNMLIGPAAVLSNMSHLAISWECQCIQLVFFIRTRHIQFFCMFELYFFFFFTSLWNNIFQSVNLRTGQFYMAVMFPQLDVKTGIQINKHSPWDTSFGHHASLLYTFLF